MFIKCQQDNLIEKGILFYGQMTFLFFTVWPVSMTVVHHAIPDTVMDLVLPLIMVFATYQENTQWPSTIATDSFGLNGRS